MRECACGFTAGTDAALQRHLDRGLTAACRPVVAPPSRGAQQQQQSPMMRLLDRAQAGDAAGVRQALRTNGVLESPLAVKPLDVTVRAGHCEAASVIVRHCRKHFAHRVGSELNGFNVVANVLNWAAAGYCGVHGPRMVAMLANDRHLDSLRKSPLAAWRRLGVLLGKPGDLAGPSQDEAEEWDDEGALTQQGQNALRTAQCAAGPVPGLGSGGEAFGSSGGSGGGSSSSSGGGGAARWQPKSAMLKQAGQRLVAEQLHAIYNDLDRRGWSTDDHRHFPPRFRGAVRATLLCARRADCPLAKLPADVLLHLFGTLARRWLWQLDVAVVH
tara:strand:+ start:1455 stop:2441 length:987 start_codon:yes stop_codon:yes gene_type:complete